MRTLAARMIVAVLLLGTIRAQADVTLELTPTLLSATQGDSLSLLATLTNDTGHTVFLTGSGGDITGPSSTAVNFDDTGFQLNLPYSLTSHQSYQQAITVAVTGDAPDGTYTFQYAVTGYPAGISTEFIATDSAELDVTSAVAGAPEAGTALLLGCGMLGLCIVRYREREQDRRRAK